MRSKQWRMPPDAVITASRAIIRDFLRATAARFRVLAESAPTSRHRTDLLDMAAAYDELARQAEADV